MTENSAVAGVSAQWPARLWVVRHGQSAGNVARDIAESNGAALIDLEHRDADIPLSASASARPRGWARGWRGCPSTSGRR